MVDRFKFSIELNDIISINRVEKVMFNYSHTKTKSGVDKWFVNINNLSIEYVNKNHRLYVCSNAFTYACRLNIGQMNLSEFYNVLADIYRYINDFFDYNFVELGMWKVEKFEINNDIICTSIKEKNLILEKIKHNADVGHFKRSIIYDSGLYMYNNYFVFKAYSKYEEFVAHNKKGSITKSGFIVDDIRKTIRLEFEIMHRKLLKIMKKLSGKDYKVILLRDILNPYILQKIYECLIDSLNLSYKITTLYNAKKVIKQKVKSKSMQTKLIDFLIYANSHSVAATKRFYKQKFYRYIKKLKEVTLCFLCIINSSSNIVFSAVKKYKYACISLLQQFIKTCNIDISKTLMNNIDILFIIFSCYKLKILI